MSVEFSQQRFEAARRIVQVCDPVDLAELADGVLQVVETAPSTNQLAWEFLNQGMAAGTAVLALEQTSGRGQWGRQWLSPPGGLYLSVALTPNLAVEHSAQLTLCTAWGIATALRNIPGQLSGVETMLPIQLKWLNDLVVQGRKLGGILTETKVQQERITKAVVGVGINWANPVPEIGINLQELLESQPVPLIESLEMLTAITLHGLLWGYQRWQQQGIELILAEYFELLADRDRPVMVEGRSGTIVGITPTGDLRVQLGSSIPGSAIALPASPEEILLQPGTISFGYNP